MPNNDWLEHKMHVMQSLERLEESQEEQTRHISEIHREIVGFKTNQKWEFRVLSAIWGVLVTAFNFFIKGDPS